MSNRGYIDTAVTCAQANPVLPLSVYLTLTDQYSNPDARDSPQIVHKPFHMALISLRIRKVLSGQPGDSHRSLQAYLHPLQRVLERMQIRLEGAMAISWLTAADFADSEADESHVAGIVDNLRAIAGVRVGVLIREREVDGKRKHRVSPVSYTHLRAHETKANLVCRLLL